MLRLYCIFASFIFTLVGAEQSFKTMTTGPDTTLRTLPQRQAGGDSSYIITGSPGIFPLGSGSLLATNGSPYGTRIYPSINIPSGVGISPSVPSASSFSIPPGPGTGNIAFIPATGNSNQQLRGSAPILGSLNPTIPGTGPVAPYPTRATTPICEVQ